MKPFILMLIILVANLEAATRSRNYLKYRARQLPFPKQPEGNTWEDADVTEVDEQNEFRLLNKQTDKINLKNEMGAVFNSSPNQPPANVVRQFYPGFPENNMSVILRPNQPDGLFQFGQTKEPDMPSEADRPEEQGQIGQQIPPPGCLAARGQFPSMNSCSNYLNCWDDIVIEQPCPNNLLFNDMTGLCDFEQNVNCGDRPGPTPKPSLQPTTRRCPDPNGRYRSQTNCSEFYICLAGSPIKFNCPRGLVYNDDVSVCDYPYNVDCQGAATPEPVLLHPIGNPNGSDSFSDGNSLSTSFPNEFSSSSSNGLMPVSLRPGGFQSVEPSRPPPQVTFPPGPYPQNQWGLRSEIRNQRSTVLLPELNDQQREKKIVTGDITKLIQEVPAETSVVHDQKGTAHVIPTEWTKLPCENEKILRLDEACTNVVVCKNGRPQFIACDVGFAYDRISESCKNYTTAKCD
ncbi:uncharacterized protein LOC103573857 isoform X1 [Microplitis demolitor]|uniref:uncharacterized protein LOC103573857 isoform X1 n=2 Tax=Microplitis demolitor TaxID=69319 RepID=UPI0004CCDE1C|nr:uncharacterized protein LOC103573857 isoform X1 [Microplitis demolitor]